MNHSVDSTLLAPSGGTEAGSHSIGEILIGLGFLDVSAAERIAEAQRTQGLRFGDAAVRLKILTAADIEFALAKQFEYHYIDAKDASVSRELVSALQPFGPFAEKMRSLRTSLQVARAAQPGAPATVGIISPGAKEGRSFIAANLAIAFSQMGERTLLVDADMRNSSQQRFFNMPSSMGLSNVLLGRADTSCIARVPHFFDLSVLTGGSAPPNPQELLTRARFASLLEELAKAYDVLIVDTPPATSFADARIIASRVGMNVLVARAGTTEARDLERAHNDLTASGAVVVGTVLNDA